MTMPQSLAFATTDDLAARVGPIPESELTRAAGAISDASALIASEVGMTLAVEWAANGAPVDVFAVVLAAAGRVYRNPEGLTSQTVGPISETRAASSVSSYLTAYERGIVRRAAGKTSLSTVSTTRGDSGAAFRQTFLPTADGSGEPVQWFPEWDWAEGGYWP